MAVWGDVTEFEFRNAHEKRVQYKFVDAVLFDNWQPYTLEVQVCVCVHASELQRVR